MNQEPTVFVVDDDPAVLASVAKLLRIIFSRVEAYPSASDFLAAYDGSRPGCLVLDVAMPGMSGLELHKKLAERDIEIPVVFITGHGNVQMAVSAMKSGAINFLEKPFREQELWSSVRLALETDRQNRRRRARKAEIRKRMERLSVGERGVLQQILTGKTNREIAAELELSVRTVEDRRGRLMRKLEAGSLVELVRMVVEE